MPFARPTRSQLIQQVAGDIDANLPTGTALLRFSNLPIIGKVLAGLANGFYGYLDWIARQIVPFTATGEHLEGWAALKRVTRKPSTAASGSVSFPATNDSVVPVNTPVLRADGATYIATAAAIAAGDVVVVPVTATFAGASGNAGAGTAMTLGAGISGVSAAGQVSAAIVGGSDMELDDPLRSRMLAAYAAPPQGGARSDYIEWALAVPGVTRCWIYPSAMGPGTVVLLFMMDDAEAAHGGFPQGANGCAAGETRDTAATGDQLILANAIYENQPVTALVYAVAPTPNAIDLTLSGLSAASGATRAAVAAAFRAALQVNAVPGGTTALSAIEAAVAGVAGTSGFLITAIAASAGAINPAPIGNIVSAAGALPVAGVITYL